MKKLYFLAALALIAAGCAKEAQAPVVEEFEETPEVVIEPSTVVFTAGIDTKAYLDGSAVKWSGDEHITIWNGTDAAEFTTTDSGTSATFTTLDTFDEAASYTAIYPADGFAAFSTGSVSTTLPATQAATAGSFDPAANLAVASSTTTSLTFYNLVAYLKFTVPAGMTDLTSVSFSGNEGQKVAGACTIDVDEKALSASGSETATLSGKFAAGSSYYLAIAPQTFTGGYTVTITRSSGTYTMVSTKKVPFTRATARNIGNLWDGSYVVTGSAISTTTATKTVGPRVNSNASLLEYTYGYRGNLSAGEVAIKKAYSSASLASATIPAAGWYHLFYNETTDTFKLYDQELSVNFGSNIDGMNSIPGYAEGSSAVLHDYFIDEDTSVNVTVGSGFNATYSNGSYSGDSWSFNLDDYYFSVPMLNSNLAISGKTGDGDLGPATVTIAGLNASKRYDILISAGRYGGSLAARKTDITIGATTKYYNQGLDRTGSTPATSVEFRAHNVALFEGIAPNVSGEVTLSVTSIDTGSANEAHLGCIFISRVVE